MTVPPVAIHRRDHPRSRGENREGAENLTPTEGSSPLTRGKPRVSKPAGKAKGIIPAHAGKTQTGAAVRSTRRDHPRSRGENLEPFGDDGGRRGSSPLTRGKPYGFATVEVTQGIIPAHAGKTPGGCGIRSSRGDHPRSRGENLEDHWEVLEADWIIPAHAGKTPSRPRCCRGWGDHPRSRGENKQLQHGAVIALGSSPLTRGKPEFVEDDGAHVGIIPAHAGKTRCACPWGLSVGDHPRSRGENVFRAILAITAAGSSPLTRGKPVGSLCGRRLGGIIPAHAGKTLACRSRR